MKLSSSDLYCSRYTFGDHWITRITLMISKMQYVVDKSWGFAHSHCSLQALRWFQMPTIPVIERLISKDEVSRTPKTDNDKWHPWPFRFGNRHGSFVAAATQNRLLWNTSWHAIYQSQWGWKEQFDDAMIEASSWLWRILFLCLTAISGSAIS